MNVLFCDQSLTKFGYSIYSVSTSSSVLMTTGLLKLNTKLDVMCRLQQIENWLNEIIKQYQIRQVVVEEIQMQRNVQTFRKLSTLFYVLESVCWRKGIPFQSLHVSTWRTHGIMKILKLPDGKKQTLYNYFYDQFGTVNSYDTNVSDALGIGLYWCRATYPDAEIHMDVQKNLESKLTL